MDAVNLNTLTAPGDTKVETPGKDAPREHVWLFSKTERCCLSEDFHLREFKCRCRSSRCHMTLVHPRLVESLQTLRATLARPLMVLCGYRCVSYNRIVGGRPRSFHTRGMAADVLCQQLEQLQELAQAAEQLPAIGGIGEYPVRGFVHLDVRERDAAGCPEKWRA